MGGWMFPLGLAGLIALAMSQDEARERRLAWFREAKFGMFIHWGLYAIPAGVWKGQEIPGIGEWIMNRARIPVREYEQLAKQFNPTQFNAEEWVRVAKEAGMRYMVITAKHHDGFSMYDSKVTTYDIVDATPFGRDPMKELAEACRRAGLKFGFYYSHAQDWHHPDAAGNTWDYPDETKKNFARYLEEKAKPQVRELLTQYGPIAILWFDTPRVITPEQSKELTDLVHQLQPDCLVCSRVGHGFGDYRVMGDNQIPAGVIEEPWETPATINDTWGYKRNDHNWKPVERLLFNLVDIVSKGGNYLLNVGPTAEGIIPQPSVERLLAMGQWLRRNGEAIYGAGPTPFRRLPWRCTTKPGRLFVHLFSWQWPGERMEIPGLKNPVARAYFLSEPQRALPVRRTETGWSLDLPEQPPDPIDSVLVLEIEGLPQVEAQFLRQEEDGQVVLPAREASLDARRARYEPDKDCIGFWTDRRDLAQWEFELLRPGTFSVVVVQACTPEEAGSRYAVTVGSQELRGQVRETSSWTKFVEVTLGQVALTQPGRYTLTVRPLALARSALMNLRAIILKPVQP